MKFITDYRLEHFILDTRWETLPEPVQERYPISVLRLCYALFAGADFAAFETMLE